MTLTCEERRLTMALPGDDWALELRWDEQARPPFVGVEGNAVRCVHQGFEYRLVVERGRVDYDAASRVLRLHSRDGAVMMDF